MKRLIAVIVMLCLISSFFLCGYAAETDQEMNTHPGTITAEGQAILDERPVLTVFVCIAAGILVICLILMVLSIVRFRKTSHALRDFCTNLGWVKTVPDVHTCTKISIVLCALNVLLPCINMAVAFSYMSAIKNLTLSVFVTVFLTSCLTSCISVILSASTGLALAVIGICKSRKQTMGILACFLHGLVLLLFAFPMLAGL